ncbi:proline-rich protein 15-like [Paramormyrops kingsleyae]|uniref:proline-rich protein 15-like n=1 Tax=Paramormyrops kingsleyae TaxID=1676925 RepID=UPI003B973BEC
MSSKNPWWRSITTKRKVSVGSKEAAVLQKQESDLDPRAKGAQEDVHQTPQQQASQVGEDTSEESQFSEKSSRRNLKVSRSGRFKEKRKVRAALPVNYDENAPENEGVP